MNLKFVIIFTLLVGVFGDEEFSINFNNQTEIADKNNVLVLNYSNFNETLESHYFLFVNFYLERCQHKLPELNCQFEAAADIMAEKNPDLKLAKVNGDEESELGKQNKIRAYPTLLLFTNGTNPIKYVGLCEADEMVEWLVAKTMDPSGCGFNQSQGALTLSIFLLFLKQLLF